MESVQSQSFLKQQGYLLFYLVKNTFKYLVIYKDEQLYVIYIPLIHYCSYYVCQGFRLPKDRRPPLI